MDDALGHVKAALTEIGALPGTDLERTSPLYGTKPWGKPDQPDFVNAVVEILTTLAAGQLLTAVKAIERAHGRLPGERWGPRPLDIDILMYGDTIVAEPGLQVPHPRMWDRGFVLRPLADLRPDFTGPDGRTIHDRLTDTEIADQEVWPLN
jgi:2-amino-4-hydroxy-6-hydroxymethyldihydropteridine diphosphokinase